MTLPNLLPRYAISQILPTYCNWGIRSVSYSDETDEIMLTLAKRGSAPVREKKNLPISQQEKR